jgi:hypothetical protein
MGSLLLVTVGLALFGQSLWFIPTDTDDVLVLSSVARAENPITYFVNDVGLGKNEYRPLHAISVWMTYQLVGVRAIVHQTINLVLHLCNTLLLFNLLSRLNKNYTIVTILALMFLVSLYAVSPASWISDRPTLLVGLAVLLLLTHVVRVRQGKSSFRMSVFAGVSALALLSKESGLVIPLSGALLGYLMPLGTSTRRRLQAVSGILLMGYIIIRLAVFGDAGFSYRETGYILGSMHYEDLSSLPVHLRAYAFAENIVKNVIGVAAPVFDNQGRAEIPSPLPAGVCVLFASLALVALALRHRLTGDQKIALVLILVNGLNHAAVFRHRTLYLSVLCLSVFLVPAGPFTGRVRWSMVAATAAIVLIMGSIVLSSSRLVSLSEMRQHRGLDLRQSLSRSSIGDKADRVHPAVLDAIERHYRRTSE